MRDGRLLLLPLVLAAVPLLAACGGDDGEGIEVSPLIHDFGRVQQGEMPSRTFTITNHTNRVVSVMPQPNCSCFATPRGRSLKPLDPGASMEIEVLFDTTAKPPGPVQGKWVSFNFDHQQYRQRNVPLSGEIYRAWDLRPEKINLGRIDGRPKNHEPRVITIRPEPGYKVKVKKVVTMPPIFDAELKPTDREGTEVHLALQKDLRPRPLGVFKAVVRIEMDVTAPGGKTFEQRPTVNVLGTWAMLSDGTPVGGARRR